MSAGTLHSLSAIFGGSAFIFSCRVTGAALTLLTQIALARWMGAAELGIYVIAFSWCVLLAVVSHVGLTPATLRVIGRAVAEHKPGVIWGFARRGGQIVLGVSVVLALVVGLLVVFSTDRLPGANAAPFLLALATAPLLALISFQGQIAVAFRWLKTAFLPSEVFRPLLLILIVAAIWKSTETLNAATVMTVQAALMFATTIVLVLILRARLRAEVRAAPAEYEARAWLRIGMPLLLISLFGGYFSEFMVILIGAQVPSDQVAIFNASYRLALLITFGLASIDSVTAPVASRLYAGRDIAELQAVVRRATKLGFLCSLVAVAGFVVFGRFMLGLFGEEFVVGHGTMMILAAAQLVRSAAGPVMSLMSVTGHQDSCLIVFASALVAAVILVFALVPFFGIQGAAMTVFFVTLGWSVWLHRLVVSHLGIRPSIFSVFGRA
jgi:O-antigen/teichoic acid export membrane protein